MTLARTIRLTIISFHFFLICEFAEAQGLELVPKSEYSKFSAPPRLTGAAKPRRYYEIPAEQLPRARNQGGQSSCTGWAVGYAFLSYYYGRKSGNGLSTDNTFSPSYIYNSLKTCTNCDCGITIPDALDFIKNNGNVPIQIYPYDEAFCGRPETNLRSIAARNKIKDWKRVENEHDITELKSYILSDVPVIIAAKVNDNFNKFRYKSENDILQWGNAPISGYHAMLVVGFDDDRQALKVMNSWGTEWGFRGFAWISYSTFNYMIEEAYVVSRDFGTQEIIDETNKSTISPENFRPYVLKEQVRSGRYFFTIGFHIDKSILPSVNKIVYIYDHPSFYSKYSASTQSPYFSNSYEGWGCLNSMKAIAYLSNGQKVVIEFDACALINRESSQTTNLDEVNVTPIVTVQSLNTPGRFYFTVKLRGIENIKERIQSVTYDRNHSSFAQRYVTTTDAKRDFEGGYDGWGCLQNLGIILNYKDGTHKRINVNMCQQIGW